MEKQKNINFYMRNVLIDWIVEIFFSKELNDKTLYITIDLIDRVLDKVLIEKDELQLLGIVCVYLATKFEEIYFVLKKDLLTLCMDMYDYEQLLDMENRVLVALDFDIGRTTAYDILMVFG